MAELIFCIAAYNADKTLPYTLRSIEPYADRIIIVDGRFQGREGSTKNSTDSTRKAALAFGCEYIRAGDLPQHRQRDLYLRGWPGDFYFIIDSDEVLEGHFDKDGILTGPYNCYAVWIRNPPGYYPSATLTMRIYRHIGERPSHSEGQILCDGYGRLMDGSYAGATMTDSFWLQHLKPG